jgi:hypothetical protein
MIRAMHHCGSLKWSDHSNILFEASRDFTLKSNIEVLYATLGDSHAMGHVVLVFTSHYMIGIG